MANESKAKSQNTDLDEEDDKTTVVINLDGLEDLMSDSSGSIEQNVEDLIDGLSEKPAPTETKSLMLKSNSDASQTKVDLDDIFDRNLPEQETLDQNFSPEIKEDIKEEIKEEIKEVVKEENKEFDLNLEEEEHENVTAPTSPPSDSDEKGLDLGDMSAADDLSFEERGETQSPQMLNEVEGDQIEILPDADGEFVSSGGVEPSASDESASAEISEGGLDLGEGGEEFTFEKKEEIKPSSKNSEEMEIPEDDIPLVGSSNKADKTGTMEINPTDLDKVPLPVGIEGEEGEGQDFREFKFNNEGSPSSGTPKIAQKIEQEVPGDNFLDIPGAPTDDMPNMSQDTDILGPTFNSNSNSASTSIPTSIAKMNSAKGNFSSSDINESHREFMSYHENELIKLSSLIKGLRADREKLIGQIEIYEKEKNEWHKNELTLQAENEEMRIELSIIKKNHYEEVERLQYQIKIIQNKKEMALEQNKKLKNDYDQLNQKIKLDVRKVRGHEQELENQLELLRADSQAQLLNREQKITELKRQIEVMEFDFENMISSEKKLKEQVVVLEAKLQKVTKALSSGLDFLAVPDLEVSKARLVRKVKI